MHLTTLHSFNPDFKPEFKVDSNTKLVLFKQFDDRKNLYNGNFSEGEIH